MTVPAGATHTRTHRAATAYIFQDWTVNRATRLRLALALLRLAQHLRSTLGRGNPLALLAAVVYRIYAETVGSFEIPVATQIGPRFRISHGFGLVVNAGAVIGADVWVRHCVTIGNTGAGGAAPVIGDGVVIGVGASILGPVRVGDGARIGAHALVLDDVGPNVRVRGQQ